MDPIHVPIVETIFKVIEERIPFGRTITTLLSLVIVLSVGTFCLQYLWSVVTPIVGGHSPQWPEWLHDLKWLALGLGIWFVTSIAARWLYATPEAQRKNAMGQEEILRLLKKLAKED
jgi:hypothetical protein